MEIKTYRAATMQEALAMVRSDLGPSAAVLHTREVGNTGLWKWLPGASRRIEVTAALDVNVPSRFPAKPTPRVEPMPSPKLESTATYEPSYVAPPQRSSLPPPQHTEVQTQISQLQALVEDLCRRTRGQGHHDLPQSLFRLYTDLIEAEVNEETARDLVERLRRESAPHDLEDVMLLRARMARMIEEQIVTTGPIHVESGRRRLVALVGPTGVGKTTTIAKLAANFRLREKKKVGLITVDTYRIAAVEQLRTYADIIDLPMHVVSTPREMRDAVNSLASLDLILLDTAGRSPHDDVKIQELKSFLVEAQADEVHLVLSTTTGASSLEKTAKQFAAAGTTHLILTKLDEAASLGNLLPLVRSSRLPLSYVTDGQSVPDDISAADSGRLARVILGIDAPTAGRRSLVA